MSGKRLVPRALARQDVAQAVDWYVNEAGPKVALGFIDALERAYDAIARNPAAGSPRYGHELNLPALRSLRLRRYPYLVFYAERDDRVEVWRVLHAQRDIPATLQEAGL